MLSDLESRLGVVLKRAGLRHISPQALRAAVVCLILLACLAVWRWWPDREVAEASSPDEWAAPEPASVPTPSSAVESATVFVHVVGAVRRPGVYELAAGDRVADVVAAAGGVLPDAMTSAVNLARVLTDGEQVLVPDEDDVADARLPTGPAASSSGGSSAPGQPVNLNSADAAALDLLPGIGPSTAAKIVAEREANGPFARVEDLGRVSGIGEKKLAQLQGLVCVR